MQRRLSAALRENLKRRKAQAKGRASAEAARCTRKASRFRRNYRRQVSDAGRRCGGTLLQYRPMRRISGSVHRRLRHSLFRTNGVGEGHGSHSHRRRPQAARHHPDLRRQECDAAADDREPADRSDADPRQRSAARRREHPAAHPRQSRRRHHGRRQASRRDAVRRADAAHFGRPHHRYHRALRTGLAHARELLGDRAARGALGRGQGLAARRLCHRHAPGRLPAHGAGAARRQDRDRRRLCHRPRRQGLAGRRDRLSRR